MTAWLWFLFGAVAAAPIWIAVTLWAARRLWRTARRLSQRAKGQEHLAELGQLVGGLAHEIKNPLSTINVSLQLLSEDASRQRDAEHQRWQRRLQHVREEVDRLRGILEDFLRFAGKYELQLAVVDLREVVSELVDFFSPQADTARVVIRASLPQEKVPSRLDVALFKQALLNLMINAVQAMPEGGELLIKVSTQRSRVLVEVIDTGSGIEGELLGRIFDVYYSTTRGGSGLGLPTTRRIIRELDGDITVESEPGKGTRFVISLPQASP
jgi:signal transduction histidine kinase